MSATRRPTPAQLRILRRLCEPGAYLHVTYGWATSAYVSKDDGRYYHSVKWSTLHALTAHPRGWLQADVNPGTTRANTATYRITDAGRAAVAAAQKKEGE